MKYSFSLQIAIFAAFLLSACTEVIELDFNDADAEIVIEADLGNNGDSAIVKISRSVNFSDSSVFPTVENALVIMSDDLGNRDTLSEIAAGLYSSGFSGLSGHQYFLEVSTDGKLLTSTSYLHTAVNFDSLLINEVVGIGGPPNNQSGKRYEVAVCFQDPALVPNYYRFVEYINGNRSNRVFISDDRLTDGTATRLVLRGGTSRYDPGDLVTFEMQSIDKPVYEYFNSFGNLNGGPQAASSPANPYTNIEGSKLGYFSAHSVQRLSFLIP